MDRKYPFLFDNAFIIISQKEVSVDNWSLLRATSILLYCFSISAVFIFPHCVYFLKPYQFSHQFTSSCFFNTETFSYLYYSIFSARLHPFNYFF